MRNRIFTAIASVLGFSSFAFGASGAEQEGSGLLLVLFIGFGSLVVAMQFIPGMVMLYSMLKGIFTPAAKEHKASAATK
jgi:hypothetical protein